MIAVTARNVHGGGGRAAWISAYDQPTASPPRPAMTRPTGAMNQIGWIQVMDHQEGKQSGDAGANAGDEEGRHLLKRAHLGCKWREYPLAGIFARCLP